MSSFGEELRRERELRQISLREVSEATKINLRYLDALENNDFRHLPGGVFNKGFVRAYSEYIGIDPEAMVNAYLLEERAQGDRAEEPRRPVPRHAPAALPADRAEPREAAPVVAPDVAPRRVVVLASRRVVVLVAVALTALLLMALLVYWLGRRDSARPPAPAASAIPTVSRAA